MGLGSREGAGLSYPRNLAGFMVVLGAGWRGGGPMALRGREGSNPWDPVGFANSRWNPFGGLLDFKHLGVLNRPFWHYKPLQVGDRGDDVQILTL